jgi:hypothetical protein
LNLDKYSASLLRILQNKYWNKKMSRFRINLNDSFV